MTRDELFADASRKTRHHAQLAVDRPLILSDVRLPFQHGGRGLVVWANVDKCKHSASMEQAMSLAKNTISSFLGDFVKSVPVKQGRCNKCKTMKGLVHEVG